MGSREFNPQEWQQVHGHFTDGMLGSRAPRGSVQRAQMVNALLRKHFLAGISQDQGRRLLGEPEGSGGGKNSAGHWHQEDLYHLVDRPDPLDVPSLLCRWQSLDPILRVEYENDRLKTATVQ